MKGTTCYRIPQSDGFNVEFNLNIIDTPGFSDNDERNLETIQQLRILFTGEVKFIDALCLVLPSACRLTMDQRHIFQSILKIFPSDDFCFIPLITFDDGGNINAFEVLKQANVKYMDHMVCRFNNAGLLNLSESETAWNRRRESLMNLFGKLTVLAKQPLEKPREAMTKLIIDYIMKPIFDLKQSITENLETIKDSKIKLRNFQQQQKNNENYTYEIQEKAKVLTSTNHRNCNACQKTCVKGLNCLLSNTCCWFFYKGWLSFLKFIFICLFHGRYNDLYDRLCSSFLRCAECKCWKTDHVQEEKVFESKIVKKVITEMKNAYDAATNNIFTCKENIRRMKPVLTDSLPKCEDGLCKLKGKLKCMQIKLDTKTRGEIKEIDKFLVDAKNLLEIECGTYLCN